MDEWRVHAGDVSVSWLPRVRSEFWLAWNNSGHHLRSWLSWLSSGWMTELVGPLSLLSTRPYTRLFVMLCYPLPGNLWGWNREETDLVVFFLVHASFSLLGSWDERAHRLECRWRHPWQGCPDAVSGMQPDLLDTAIQALEKGFLFFWMELESGEKPEMGVFLSILFCLWKDQRRYLCGNIPQGFLLAIWVMTAVMTLI